MKKLTGFLIFIILILIICSPAAALSYKTSVKAIFTVQTCLNMPRETCTVCVTAKNVTLKAGSEYFDVQWDSKGITPFPRGRVIKLVKDTPVSVLKNYVNGFALFYMGGKNFVTYARNVTDAEPLSTVKPVLEPLPKTTDDETENSSSILPHTGDASDSAWPAALTLPLSAGALTYAIKRQRNSIAQ